MTITHACPVGDAAVTPCCFRSPFELLGDRMTLAAELVTCERPVEPVDAEAIAMRLVNATPGPWGILDEEFYSRVGTAEAGDIAHVGSKGADAVLIMNARDDLGALLRERGSLVDRLDEAETKLAFLVSGSWLLTRDELLQRVTAVGPERTAAADWLSTRLHAERLPLQAQIDAVRALHYERDAGDLGMLCREDEQRWPCKTARALQ